MKKNFKYALLGAVALTGAVSFSACQSSDEVVETNPNYNPETREVTTQFVLNVAANTGNNVTRQSNTIVQQGNYEFRGISDAKLIALATEKPTWLAPFDGTTSTGMSPKTFELGTLYTPSQIVDQGNDPNINDYNSSSKSNRVLQLSLPVGMDAMLVYARAIPSGVDNADGKVVMNVTAAPENTTFTLQPRLETSTETNKPTSTVYNNTLALSAAIINHIMSSHIPQIAAGEGDAINGYKNKEVLAALSWKDLGDTKTIVDGLTGLPEILGKDYYALTTMTELPTTDESNPPAHPNEYRAGSSTAVRHLIYHIYTDCVSVIGATATDDSEYAAQLLAMEIKDRIDRYFTDADNSTAIAFLPITTTTGNTNISYHLTSDLSLAEGAFATTYAGVTNDYLAGFPSVFGLPDGVALLTIDANDVFSYNISNTTVLLDGMTAVSHYMYPAELLYFDNSALRCNRNPVGTGTGFAQYPDGYTPWDTDGSWGGWTTGESGDSNGDGGVVSSSTRSVAVKNNINYGVAMLKTAVALDGNAFSDNRQAFTGEADQVLDVDDVGGFKLTGVLVGGQNYQMGWNYLAKAPETADNWNYVVYDNSIPSGTIPTGTGNENYTLLFDNYNSTLANNAQQAVNVALEFVNESGPAFFGEHNLIPTGGKFYLVGNLTIGQNSITTGWDDKYPVPPYYTAEEATEANNNALAGTSKKITRIFVQDFMTSAVFKIGVNSLKKAYNTIPDLRSTQTSLGLSVNLTWQPGLTFDNVTLGH